MIAMKVCKLNENLPLPLLSLFFNRSILTSHLKNVKLEKYNSNLKISLKF